jgi:hypothetical protein
MQVTEQQRLYWQKNLRITSVLLAKIGRASCRERVS